MTGGRLGGRQIDFETSLGFGLETSLRGPSQPMEHNDQEAYGINSVARLPDRSMAQKKAPRWCRGPGLRIRLNAAKSQGGDSGGIVPLLVAGRSRVIKPAGRGTNQKTN